MKLIQDLLSLAPKVDEAWGDDSITISVHSKTKPSELVQMLKPVIVMLGKQEAIYKNQANAHRGIRRAGDEGITLDDADVEDTIYQVADTVGDGIKDADYK